MLLRLQRASQCAPLFRLCRSIWYTNCGKLLARVPGEIICEIFSNLSNEDLKNAALCNRSMNEIATPIVYKRSTLSTLKTLFMWSEDIPKDYAANVFLDPKKNKDVDQKLIDFLAKVVCLFDVFVVFNMIHEPLPVVSSGACKSCIFSCNPHLKHY